MRRKFIAWLFLGSLIALMIVVLPLSFISEKLSEKVFVFDLSIVVLSGIWIFIETKSWKRNTIK